MYVHIYRLNGFFYILVLYDIDINIKFERCQIRYLAIYSIYILEQYGNDM